MSDNISTTVSAKAAQLSVQLSQLTKNAFPPSLTCSGGNSSCDMTYYLFFLGDGFQAKGTHQADSVSIAGALSAAMSDPTANQVLLQYASPGSVSVKIVVARHS